MTKHLKLIRQRWKNIRLNAHSSLPGLKQTEIKDQAKQNFMNTDYTFKLYNQAHPDYKLSMPKEPKFSDMYQPSDLQKQGELLFVSGGALALGYGAFRFL